MARVDWDRFLEKDLGRVYIAGSPKEARRVEDVLGAHRVDWAVDLEPYRMALHLLLGSHALGAAFYVLSDQAAFARDALRRAGLKVGIVDEEG